MIGLFPFLARDTASILRKATGPLTSLAVGDGVVVLQGIVGTTVPTTPTGLTALAGQSFSYSVQSNNGDTTTNGASSFRISYGRATAAPIPGASTSFRTSNIISRTGDGAVTMALARTTTGSYTPTGLNNPVSYVGIAYTFGSTSAAGISTDTLTLGTINGQAPTVSQFASFSLESITAGVNTEFGVVKIKIGVWEKNFNGSPVDIVVGGSGVQAVLAVSAF